MAFTGKCTYSADSVAATLPELAEDVSDLVGILSPYETPLLDALGDPPYAAASTRHEWMEGELLPNRDSIDDGSLDDSDHATTQIHAANASLFRVGDLVKPNGSDEVILVTAVDSATGMLTVQRAYGGTSAGELSDQQGLLIVGNAALEGQDAQTRFSVRRRMANYTQIFSAGVQVSGSEAAVRQLAVADEMDYQKTCRLRELLRDLENTLINGVPNDTTAQGSATERRTMAGLLSLLTANVFTPGTADFPAGAVLTEEQLNTALRRLWESTGGRIDLLVCGGAVKRQINGFITANQRFAGTSEHFKNLVSTYESDYGVCRVVLSRYVPADALLLLDSSRIAVLPLRGRSFQFLPLAPSGDYQAGEIIGEYTMEVRNAGAQGVIRGVGGATSGS